MNPNDEIVISGIAGRFPGCNSFDEFKDALLSNIDLVTEDNKRFEPGTFNTPKKAGKINDLEYFDAGYFGISPRQADFMDPRHRVVFETVFEAIVDSGYNPKELRGTKTGVYVGMGSLDTADSFKDIENSNGYTAIGLWMGHVANRTSYCFDFKGPSLVLDTACSSGLYAFVHAFKALENGDIDNAIVTAAHICLHPHETKEFNSLNMLSKDGKCKVFSADRDGYVRSEAIITVLLQKRSKCRRLYSTVLGADVNCDGFKVEGMTFPSSEMQLYLMNAIYEKYKINPGDVSYVEMHGTGTPAGDIAECQSVVDFFCVDKKKTEPLAIGAVKSNMGHSELSSGLGSLTKVLVAMETGIIPANLHCENIDYSLPGINTGQLKIVTKNCPWNGGLVSLNCFGFGGANSHIVLKSNEKSKLKPRKRTHRLVNISGRTEEGVRHYLDEIEKYKDDDEFLALVDEIHKMDVEGHFYRGYTVLGENSLNEIARIVKPGRPVWFMYCGMGCQWTGMGKDLMKIDIFKKTFTKCANALKPFAIDLDKVVLSEDPTVLDDLINCFVSIVAIEIALTDVLKSFGIEPNGFFGHSLGEIGCSYCNGELTPEQAILIAYARGYSTKTSKCAPGQMAAVGLSKKDMLNLLPEGVYIACVNSSTSVTITGPQDLVKHFVQDLTVKGIFARLVKSAGYAFHSKYLDDTIPVLREFLSKVVTDPKPRSSKWISSSWKESEWDNPVCKMNSGEYSCHNFANPVLFDQVMKYIPKDAIIIEVGPHGFLTPIIKKELGPEVTFLSLCNRNSKDNAQFLYSNIGQLFINGAQPNLKGFYDDVNYPVGKGTRNIGSLVKWDHNIKWFTPYFESNKSFGKKLTVNTKTEEYSFLRGHNIDGRVLMPATGYLELVWKVVASQYTKQISELPIVFESVKISRATILSEGQDVEFWINIMKQSGYFEIFEGGSVCCSGTVKSPKNVSNEFLNVDKPQSALNTHMNLKKHDIYKSFHLKKYLYTEIFQGMELVDVNGLSGKLRWNENFTAFLDSMLHIVLVPQLSSDLLLPTQLQKLVIDPTKHLEYLDENNDIPVHYNKNLKLIQSGGIEILNLEVSVAPRKYIKDTAILESQIFVPYLTDSHQNEINVEQSLKIALQIIRENIESNILRAYEVITHKDNSLVETVEKIIKSEPATNVEFLNEKADRLDFILCSDGHSETSIIPKLNRDGFVLFHGDERCARDLGLPIVYQNSYKQKGIFLLRSVTPMESLDVILVNSSDFSWMEKAKASLKIKKLLYLVAQNDDVCGIVGLVKCINLEPRESASVKCVFIQGGYSTPFNPDLDSYKEQLIKKLTINILQNGIWGSFRHITLNEMKRVEIAHASNYTQTIGDLSTFKWVERPSHYYKTSPDSENVYIFYSALNFKDVMVATGKIAGDKQVNPSSPDITLGFEYSGISQSSKRVMGVSSLSSISLQVTSDPLFTWHVPPFWSLEEAATVPVVYATCYYALMIRAHMKPNTSILIHAGAGGIGIAAISIALSMNCEVFTTCGSNEKRDFLLEMFPKLKPGNIGNSRSTLFEQMIMSNTNGRGVDIVLNSLAAEKFQASIRCVAQRGQFLEIGKVDIFGGTLISSSLFAKNTSFHGILLDDLFRDSTETKQDINRLVAEGIARGVVRPLPRTIFGEDKVEDAIRFLSTGKHKGKVLIQIRNEKSYDIQSLQRTILAVPQIYFEPDKTYILIGGLGGFGLELTSFLIKRCARKIVLNSRRGVTNGYQSLCMKKWSELDGVTVKINSDDTSSLEGAESLVKFAEEMGPVGGIFNMALVLRDALFMNQTADNFVAVFKSKIYSGANMDKVSRLRCPKLDHFVVFSSITSGRGNPGQSNYGMANSALEQLCQVRRKVGLPGLAVQYGPVGDVGAVAEVLNYNQTIDSLNLNLQSINSCLNALETFMLQPCPVVSTFVAGEQKAISLSSSKSPMETVANILGIKDMGLINKNLSLVQFGLDSLMIAEIKQTFYRNFNIELDVEEIRDLTFDKIFELFENSGEKPKSSPTAKHVNGFNGTNNHDLTSINAMLRKKSIVEVINDKSYKSKVFLVHPIEGNVEILLPLAQRLNSNIYGLQATKDLDLEDLRTYATHFIKEIKTIQSCGPYWLCGYSYGGSLAYEMGVQLENLNEKVNIFFIDGTPSFTKLILQHIYVKDRTSEAKRNILKAFLNTFDEIDYEQAVESLNEISSWKEQLEYVGNFVAEKTSYNAQDVAISAERFKQRVAAAYFYEPCKVFNGPATLFRSSLVYKDLPADYDLQKVCKQTINLYQFDCDHKDILMGDNLAKIAEYMNNNLK